MTNEPPGDDGAWLQTCRQVIRKLITEFQWTLVTEDELLATVATRQPDPCPSTVLQQTVIHTYAAALYTSCRQTSDTPRRERAYTDLSHFLYRFAYKRMPDRAEDIVNQTLLTVYEQIDSCREPGAFLSFAWWKLRSVMKKVQQQDRVTFFLPEENEQSFVIDTDPGPEEQALHSEQLRIVATRMQQLLTLREQQVIILTFLKDYSDRDIAHSLNLPASHVRVIRHRALEKLRRNLNVENDAQENDRH